MVSCWLWPGNLGRMWLGVVCWGGVLCENCIVDANAIIIMAMAIMIVVVCFSFLWFLFLVFFVVCA